MLFDSTNRFFDDVIRYREPLMSLTGKEFRVRYKHAALGFLWTVLNPLLLMVVLSLVMPIMHRDPIGDHPYPVFALCGLIPWTFLAHTLSRSSGALLDNASLIQKVKFPREIVTLSVVMSCFMNYLLALAVLLCFVLAYGYMPGFTILLAPVLVAAQLMFVTGIALAVSSLNVFYRDVAYMVESLLVVWWWGSPIFYPSFWVRDVAPDWFYRVYMANPVAALVDSMRMVLLDKQLPDPSLVITLFVAAVVTFIIGVAIFRRSSSAIVDYV